MATLTTKTFPQVLEGIAAAVQGSASGLVDFTIGSFARALGEAFAGVVVWLESLILILLTATRASTSIGSDLDSWIADFGAAPAAGDETLIARTPAAASVGALTFSRLTTSGQANVPVGSTVATQDGLQSFVVTLDASNPAYDGGLNAYVLAVSVANVTVPAAATNTGAATNAAAGAVNTITSAIPGVDAVTNAGAFTGGADAETDTALRPRFRRVVAGLARGTPASIKQTVEGLQSGVTAKVVEKLNFDGTSHPGYFYVLVDDGTGVPSSDLLTAAGAAVDAYHAAGLPFAVYAPTVVNINVAATLVTSANHSAAVATASAAIIAYLDALPISATVYWSRIWQVLQDSSPDILEVTGVTLNSGSSDITMTTNQVAKAHTIAIA